MGNQQGAMAGADGAGGSAPNKPIINLDFSNLGRKDPRDSNNAPMSPLEDGNRGRRKKRQDGDIAVGDSFVTWISSSMTEVSYARGKVVDIFDMAVGTPLYGSRKEQARKKCVWAGGVAQR